MEHSKTAHGRMAGILAEYGMALEELDTARKEAMDALDASRDSGVLDGRVIDRIVAVSDRMTQLRQRIRMIYAA